MPTPRLEIVGPLRLVGLMRSHNATQEDKAIYLSVAVQWQDYIARRAEQPAPKNDFGVFACMADGATHFEYFSGAPSEVPVPQGFVELDLPLMRCAVFAYDDPVSGLHEFVRGVFSRQLPAAGLSLLPLGSGMPEFVVRFREGFDHAVAEGGLDVLVPVQAGGL